MPQFRGYSAVLDAYYEIILRGDNLDKKQLKAILRSAWALDIEIKSYEERIVVSRARAEKNTTHYGPQSGGSGDGKRMENDVINVVDEESYLLELIDKRRRELRKIIGYIEMLPKSPMRAVLHKRYINYHTFEQIAAELNYSWQNVHKLHSKALDYILREVNKINT